MPTYNPYQYFNPYQQQTPQTQPQQQTIQNGGLISVQSEEEARSWIVAPGNSITFKNENAPYCYTKTMGFSPLDQPKFEKYRLVKEEEPTIAATAVQATSVESVAMDPVPEYASIESVDALKKQIEGMHKRLSRLESKNRKESNNDE